MKILITDVISHGVRGCFGLLLGLSLAGCGTTAKMRSAPEPEKQAFMTTQIDKVLERRLDDAKPGMTILIVKDGNVIYNRSKGLADSAKNIPITENTPFELASVTKPMTAVAVMQLKEKGKLALTDSILKWLPELPETWHTITIEHLLSHRSGLPEYLRVTSAQLKGLDGFTNTDLLQRYINEGVLDFIPGTNADYSNSNYVVLAEIIRRVSGNSYGEYMHKNIFMPLGMNSSAVSGKAALGSEPVALNFARSKKSFFGVSPATVGDIGVTSSAADINLFVRGFLAGKIVSPESLASMTMPQSIQAVDTNREYYGYGWYVLPKAQPLSLFAHTGDQGGFRNILRINNDKGIYYVLLSNGGEATKKVMRDVGNIVQTLYENEEW